MGDLREGVTLKSRPTAIPNAAETEVELWPAPKGSYSLSPLFVNPAFSKPLVRSDDKVPDPLLEPHT